jgi:hypothetical protein
MLEIAFRERIHAVLWNFDHKLADEYAGLGDVEEATKVGRLGDLGKRDVMMEDI